MQNTITKRIAAEALATGLLVATVVGSGIMAERLAAGNVAIALLANTLATGAVLVALILTFGPISGAHMNPAVTLAAAMELELPWSDVLPYSVAQIAGGVVGTLTAHVMFGLPLVTFSALARGGGALALSEFVATFGLLGVILGVSRSRPTAVPYAVGVYIMAAYWFTSSTSFANPAVTIARCLTNSFAGIRPGDVPVFLAAQITGAVAATLLFRWLLPNPLPPNSLNAEKS
jgi:glycerol uptake facilitator-like aquaporin